MTPDEALDDETTDETADRVYAWTVRTLYVTLIGLNIWVYWRTVRDDPEFAVLRAHVDRAVARCRAPFHREQEYRKAVGRMHWQALEALEHGERSDDAGT